MAEPWPGWLKRLLRNRVFLVEEQVTDSMQKKQVFWEEVKQFQQEAFSERENCPENCRENCRRAMYWFFILWSVTEDATLPRRLMDPPLVPTRWT